MIKTGYFCKVYYRDAGTVTGLIVEEQGTRISVFLPALNVLDSFEKSDVKITKISLKVPEID